MIEITLFSILGNDNFSREDNTHAYTLQAKSEDAKQKWLEALTLAMYRIVFRFRY